MNKGSIQLVLRGYGDPDTVRTSGATSKDVLALLRGTPLATPEAPLREVRRHAVASKPKPVPVAVVMAKPAAPDSVTVSVYRGDKPTKQTFEKPSNGAVPKTP
jgi:pilus assembly protein CpaB